MTMWPIHFLEVHIKHLHLKPASKHVGTQINCIINLVFQPGASCDLWAPTVIVVLQSVLLDGPLHRRLHEGPTPGVRVVLQQHHVHGIFVIPLQTLVQNPVGGGRSNQNTQLKETLRVQHRRWAFFFLCLSQMRLSVTFYMSEEKKKTENTEIWWRASSDRLRLSLDPASAKHRKPASETPHPKREQGKGSPRVVAQSQPGVNNAPPWHRLLHLSCAR